MSALDRSRGWRRHRKGWVLLILVAAGILTWDRWRTWKENSQDKFILAAARQYGVHPALVKAIVWRESGFDPNTRGSSGEVGLMQLMKDSAREWAEAERLSLFSHTDLYDPAKNTRAGTWYFRKLYRRYPNTDNPLPYALADYNAGRQNVLKWAKGPASTNSAEFIKQIGFPGTQNYVKSVMAKYEYYAKRFPPSEKK